MIDRPFRDVLSTCSTPGVAETYFSRRHVSVFSTSFGPRPGACVPTTRTGGVSSGNVSTLMRGVTTHANTTSPMQIMRIAIGFRSERAVTASPIDLSRSDRVAVVEERATLDHDGGAGHDLRVEIQRAAGFAEH